MLDDKGCILKLFCNKQECLRDIMKYPVCIYCIDGWHVQKKVYYTFIYLNAVPLEESFWKLEELN